MYDEKAKKRSQRYYQKHKEEICAKSRDYYRRNKETALAQRKQYYQENKDYILSKKKELRKRYKDDWLILLQEKFGELKCSRCGYENDPVTGEFHFSAFHFHHTNGDKKIEPGILLGYKPSRKRMKEFDKCEILCANCHSIVEWG